MDSRQIQQILLAKTFTKSDYLRRVTYIREFLEGRFFKNNKGNFSDYLLQVKVSTHDREAISGLDEHFFNLFTKDNLYPVINSLVEELKPLPVLTLYLAVIVEDYLVDELGIWFRKNLHPELIMEVRCNPTLVSGCAYVWNNQYRDLSLHYFFKKREDLINKIIESYVHEQL